ncbi:MAG: molybdopterin molybdenumtransferase MoeA [Oscillatoriales cyanobacterium]|nr:MAG: molybdopterin molybdenumtransferase MoeA [Oscillatoriales cyanobacterium]
MISAQEAEAIALRITPPLTDSESIATLDALGRVLAEPVRSRLDFPHWDNSAMDGYAVRQADLAQGPAELQVIEIIPAGVAPQQTLGPGQAARIFTGAMLPLGADAIAIQEDTEPAGPDRVKVLSQPALGEFVRAKGTFCRAGDQILPAGLAIGPAELAALAAAQCDRVTVVRRPRVAVFSTGDELGTIDQPLQPGQIVDSNQYALIAFLRQMGAEPIALGVVPDDRAALKAAIAQAIAQADLVLSTGGVSVGDYDYVDAVLAELGGEIHVKSVAVRPGKPLTLATFGPKVYGGLPGNPVSALVGCWRFVAPMLRKLSGRSGPHGAQWLTARSLQDLSGAGRRETYLWGQWRVVDGQLAFTLAHGSHSSGNLINLAGTTALARIPQGVSTVAAGSEVQLLLIEPLI